MSNTVATCHYLFGDSCANIFKSEELRSLAPSFVDTCLETLMDVHFYLFSEKKLFSLLNPAAFNNQCHLYALRVGQIRKENFGKEARTENNRFFHLCAFLSFNFLHNPTLLCKVVKKVANDAKIDLPQPEKKFYLFVKDPLGERTRCARIALNEAFKNGLRECLKPGEEEIQKELYKLSLIDLKAPLNNGDGLFYTFPKLSGLVYMLDTLAKEKFGLMLKVKIITTQGNSILTYVSDANQTTLIPIEENQEKRDFFILFEAIQTDSSLTIFQCQQAAERCPRSYRRVPQREKRHDETAVCLFCNPKKIDLSPHREKLASALASPQKMLFAMGVHFMKLKQQLFLPYFEDKQAFPKLTKLFEETQGDIDNLGISMDNPSGFSVCYCYIESAAFLNSLKSDELRMDFSPEEYLQRGGVA